MATNKHLQDRIDRLEAALEALTGRKAPPPTEPTERPDYVEPGGAKHAQILGLIIVPDDKIAEAEADKYILYKSRDTGITYRLYDEITILRHYPGIDPDKAARIVLRQKIGVLESGSAKVYEGAPELWQPVRSVY